MAKPHSHETTRRPSKVRPVPIAQMRVPPALVTQRRFRKAHGDHLAADLDLNKLGFPVINHRDGIYWVLDGQHRIYALRQNGFEKDVLDCEVYEDLTDEEMADIFLGRDQRRAISPFDKFHVACTAGHVRETSIRRAVETQGVRISQSRTENTVGAVSALGKVYDLAGGSKNGEVVLGQVIRTIKNAYDGVPAAFDGQVIHALGMVYNRYNGRTNERHLASALASTRGVEKLIQRAETQRLRTGNQKPQCVAASIVDVYNRGLGPRDSLRLPIVVEGSRIGWELMAPCRIHGLALAEDIAGIPFCHACKVERAIDARVESRRRYLRERTHGEFHDRQAREHVPHHPAVTP